MSASEVDDIGRETSRAARAAGRAVATFFTRTQARHPHKQISAWSDLTRSERREMKAEISRALREQQRIEAAEARELRAQLAGDIYAHHARVWSGYRPRENEQMSDWFTRQQELERDLRELETRIADANLTDTERGQAVTAVRRAHYLPMYRGQEIFVPSTGTRSLRERVQAGLSRLRIGRPRDGERQTVQNWENTARARYRGDEQARQREILRQHGGPSPQFREDYTVDRGEFAAKTAVMDVQEYTRRQVFAVQDLRSAHLQRRAEQDAGVSTDPGHQAWRAVIDRAADAGLSREQIAWELDNVDTNTRCRTTLTYRLPGQPEALAHRQEMQGLHADEAEAARWARLTLGRYDWQAGTRFELTANERDSREDPLLIARGGYLAINGAVRQWEQDLAEQPVQYTLHESGEAQPHRIDERILDASIRAHEEMDRQADARAAAESQHAPSSRTQPRGTYINGQTLVADNIGGVGNTGHVGGPIPGTPAGGRRTPPPAAGVRATASNGATSTITAEGVHITGGSRVTAGNIGGNGNNVNPMMRRTRETQTRARVAGLEQQVAELTEERDRYRSERDEAVAKIVESTPAAQRYGSPQRRAAESENDGASPSDATRAARQAMGRMRGGPSAQQVHQQQVDLENEQAQRAWADERRSTAQTVEMTESASVPPPEEPIDEPFEELTEEEN